MIFSFSCSFFAGCGPAVEEEEAVAGGGEKEVVGAEPGSGLRPVDSGVSGNGFREEPGRGLRAGLTGVSASVWPIVCSVLTIVGEVTVMVSAIGLGLLAGDGLALCVGDLEARAVGFFLCFFGGLGFGGLLLISFKAAEGTFSLIFFEGLISRQGSLDRGCASLSLSSSCGTGRFGGFIVFSAGAAGSFVFFVDIESRIPPGFAIGAGKGVGND